VILVVITIHSYNGRVVDSMMIMRYALEPNWWTRGPISSVYLGLFGCDILIS